MRRPLALSAMVVALLACAPTAQAQSREVERRAATLLEQARDRVARRVEACREPADRRPPVLGDAPSRAVRGVLGVLRRPATTEELAAARRVPPLPQIVGVLRDATRIVRLPDGSPVRLHVGLLDDRLPSLRVQRACLRRQRRELERRLRTSTPAVRRAALRLLGEQRPQRPRAPRDALFLSVPLPEDPAGGVAFAAAPFSARRFATNGVKLAVGYADGRSRLHLLLPDGVASATLNIPAGRGRGAFSMTAQVVDNVVAFDVPGPLDRLQRVTWRAADGRVLRVVG